MPKVDFRQRLTWPKKKTGKEVTKKAGSWLKTKLTWDVQPRGWNDVAVFSVGHYTNMSETQTSCEWKKGKTYSYLQRLELAAGERWRYIRGKAGELYAVYLPTGSILPRAVYMHYHHHRGLDTPVLRSSGIGAWFKKKDIQVPLVVNVNEFLLSGWVVSEALSGTDPSIGLAPPAALYSTTDLHMGMTAECAGGGGGGCRECREKGRRQGRGSAPRAHLLQTGAVLLSALQKVVQWLGVECAELETTSNQHASNRMPTLNTQAHPVLAPKLLDHPYDACSKDDARSSCAKKRHRDVRRDDAPAIANAAHTVACVVIRDQQLDTAGAGVVLVVSTGDEDVASPSGFRRVGGGPSARAWRCICVQ
ncbi:hypothetical protein K438DRAFT_1749288 [Mycena galopus ATCC 62051]|nr:hypothetical protein K438DRAFT_1749288 [Mycena galopus ATCC 62051]